AAALGDVVGTIHFETPGVETDRDVISERVGAREIEIDQTRKSVAQKKHVIRKQIGVDHTLGQIARPMGFQMRKFACDQRLQVPLYFVHACAAALEERSPASD